MRKTQILLKQHCQIYFNAQSNIVRDISMTKNVMADPSIKSVLNAKKMGEVQYQPYVTERLLTCKKSIYEVIPKKQTVFRNKNAVKFSKDKLKVVSLQQDRKLYASLFVRIIHQKYLNMVSYVKAIKLISLHV